jgi:glycerate dehydrogenase
MSLQKLVVLDGYTLNPGDLSWDALKAIAPEVEIYDRTSPGDVVERAQGAGLVLTNKVKLPGEILAQLPELKYIGVLATGYDVIDIPGARERGIVVSNVPAYSTASVVQVVFALILEFTHQVAHHAKRVREGGWATSPDFAFWDNPLIELEGKTLGIIGFGKIGQSVGRVAAAFGMKVLTASASPKDVEFPVEYVSRAEVFQRADFLSLLCPLTPETRGLVNYDVLKTMKPSAHLINTGRGPLVVEADVARALREGIIAGFGADVLSQEPPPADNPLLTTPRTLITPHYAWASVEARTRLMDVTLGNLRAFLDGAPRNVVS